MGLRGPWPFKVNPIQPSRWVISFLLGNGNQKISLYPVTCLGTVAAYRMIHCLDIYHAEWGKDREVLSQGHDIQESLVFVGLDYP